MAFDQDLNVSVFAERLDNAVAVDKHQVSVVAYQVEAGILAVVEDILVVACLAVEAFLVVAAFLVGEAFLVVGILVVACRAYRVVVAFPVEEDILAVVEGTLVVAFLFVVA